ncbi:MAG: hypothetical protein LE178_04380, partial [Endomicrobium sp.]|nr:hypothetical protein [Endomicrobium sp.]
MDEAESGMEATDKAKVKDNNKALKATTPTPPSPHPTSSSPPSHSPPHPSPSPPPSVSPQAASTPLEEKLTE